MLFTKLFISTDNMFQNNMMRNMAFLKVEMRQIQSNQSLMFKNLESILHYLQNNNSYIEKTSLSLDDFHDCPLPLDNDIDLSTLEDKVAGDHQFKSRLVILKLKFISIVLNIPIVFYISRSTNYHT